MGKIVVNLYYEGKNGSATEFAKEMTSLGIVAKIRNTEGNLRYEYFLPLEGGETVLLVDEWASQEALDRHHKSDVMREIATLREKYKLRLKVQKFEI